MSAAKMERTRHPGIYKRGSRYVVTWRHRGVQHKQSFRTLAEAREAQGERRKPESRAVTSRQWFEDYATAWLDTYTGRTERGIASTSLADYTRSIETYAIPFFRRYRLGEIEPPDIKRFAKSLSDRGLKTSSVRKNLVPLKSMLACAVEDGTLKHNPASGVRIAPSDDEHDDEPKAKAMTRRELRLVLAALPTRWRPFFELLAGTGLRISELLGLTWGDVDLGVAPHLSLRWQWYRGKRRRLKSKYSRRTIPLPPGTAKMLRERRAKLYTGDDEAPVFATRTGKPLAARNMRRVLDAAADDLGLGWASFHTFRHTYASILFAEGKNAKQVQTLLGHHDPGFTLSVYVHLMDEGVGSVDFFDDVLAGGGNAVATQQPTMAKSPVGV
jgi:integrase